VARFEARYAKRASDKKDAEKAEAAKADADN
jgi:hypothetical protein